MEKKKPRSILYEDSSLAGKIIYEGFKAVEKEIEEDIDDLFRVLYCPKGNLK